MLKVIKRKLAMMMVGGMLGVLAFGPPLKAAPMIEYSSGHADIGVAYEGGELELHYHFGGGAVLDDAPLASEAEYDPADVFVRTPDSQMVSRPGGAQWDFLGTGAGEALWYLPQGNISGVPFLGIAAEELDNDDWVGVIVYTITDVIAPIGGEFSIWQTNLFGAPAPYVSTVDGLPDGFNVPIGSHSHYNWGFTAPGVYQVTIVASGTHVSDGSVDDEETFWFAVGDQTVVPEPSGLALTGIGFGLVSLIGRRKRS